MSYLYSLDPGSSNGSKSSSPSCKSDFSFCSLSPSESPVAPSQSPQQLETHMQRPEPVITYINTTVSAKPSLYCRPVVLYNGTITFQLCSLALAPPSRRRKSGLFDLHPVPLLKQMQTFLSSAAISTRTNPAFLALAPFFYCEKLGTAIYLHVEKKLMS